MSSQDRDFGIGLFVAYFFQLPGLILLRRAS
jgi:hypothetical protein